VHSYSRPKPTARNPIRVLVADHHARSRAAVRRALEGQGFSVCAEAGDAVAAVAAALRERPDLCLLDSDIPGGLAATAEITANPPAIPVIVLAGSQSSAGLLDALRVGASGYLPKDTDPARLPFALYGVLDGEAAVPRRLVARLIQEFREPTWHRLSPPQERPHLTRREWEVLSLLRHGLTTEEIGRRLVIAPVTVRTHVAAILKKLGVSNRLAAVRLLEHR
jgi:DNA-binding NarL/FixJ family response regulator